MGMRILLTVGTTNFDQLVGNVLAVVNSYEFGETCRKLQYALEVLIQYGTTSELFPRGLPPSVKCVEPDELGEWISSTSSNRLSEAVKNHQVVSIRAVPFLSSFETFVANADAVITHAGAGSIQECLRHQKPTLAVSNASLMGNHQHELGSELAEMGWIQFFDGACLGKVDGNDVLGVSGAWRTMMQNFVFNPPQSPLEARVVEGNQKENRQRLRSEISQLLHAPEEDIFV